MAERRYPEPSLARTPAGTVEYQDVGSGPPVLVVHGSPGGWDEGLLMAGFLVAAGHRAIVPARPGYQRTPITARTATNDGQADLHAALMAHLGFDSYDVMCWSGGGPSSYRLAVRHPNAVRRLVAQAAVSRRYEWDLDMTYRFMFGTAAGARLLAALADHRPRDLIRSTLQAEGDLSRDQVRRQTDAAVSDPVQRDFVLDLARGLSIRGNRRDGAMNDRETLLGIVDLELQRISTPTLLVHGAVDTDVDPEDSRYAAAQIRGAELLMVAEGTHLAAYAGPGYRTTQERILEFLSPRAEPSDRQG